MYKAVCVAIDIKTVLICSNPIYRWHRSRLSLYYHYRLLCRSNNFKIPFKSRLIVYSFLVNVSFTRPLVTRYKRHNNMAAKIDLRLTVKKPYYTIPYFTNMQCDICRPNCKVKIQQYVKSIHVGSMQTLLIFEQGCIRQPEKVFVYWLSR